MPLILKINEALFELSAGKKNKTKYYWFTVMCQHEVKYPSSDENPNHSNFRRSGWSNLGGFFYRLALKFLIRPMNSNTSNFPRCRRCIIFFPT